MRNNNWSITRVYHWSPSENNESILQTGLKILIPQYEYKNSVTGKTEVWKPPYICTSLDPWKALCYCIPQLREEIESVDLFEVAINANDKIRIRNDYSNEIIEVRVFNSIPSDRINYIATRIL